MLGRTIHATSDKTAACLSKKNVHRFLHICPPYKDEKHGRTNNPSKVYTGIVAAVRYSGQAVFPNRISQSHDVSIRSFQPPPPIPAQTTACCPSASGAFAESQCRFFSAPESLQVLSPCSELRKYLLKRFSNARAAESRPEEELRCSIGRHAVQ